MVIDRAAALLDQHGRSLPNSHRSSHATPAPDRLVWQARDVVGSGIEEPVAQPGPAHDRFATISGGTS